MAANTAFGRLLAEKNQIISSLETFQPVSATCKPVSAQATGVKREIKNGLRRLAGTFALGAPKIARVSVSVRDAFSLSHGKQRLIFLISEMTRRAPPRWLWAQPGSNWSRQRFPVYQGNNRERSVLWRKRPKKESPPAPKLGA
jgi:hypothetical protein